MAVLNNGDQEESFVSNRKNKIWLARVRAKYENNIELSEEYEEDKEYYQKFIRWVFIGLLIWSVFCMFLGYLYGISNKVV